jgi:GntR family transcriptional regulator
MPDITQTQRLAAVLRDAIMRGDYAPGSKLPKGADLAAEHAVSLSIVYGALRSLANEGLVTLVRRGGSWVRETADATVITRNRVVLHDELGYLFDSAAKHWESPPDRPTVVSWEPPPADVGELLGTGGADVLRRYRVVGPPDAPIAQVMISHIEPGTARDLDLGGESTGLGGIYARMEDAGYVLGWSERVHARMPSPDEAAELGIPRGVPALRILRTTTAAIGGHRHVAEVTEQLMRADRYAVAYRLHRG